MNNKHCSNRHLHEESHHHNHSHYHSHEHHEEFQKFHKYIRFFRPFGLAFNLFILYLILRYEGFKAITIFFAVFIVIKGTFEMFFLARLEKRIFKPIIKLRSGVEEISKGNYDVKVEVDEFSVVNILVDSFNEMAEKLQEGERIQEEYEENRKMLIANISHDLKTPITSIQGYIEGILDGTASTQESMNKYLHIIYNNSVYVNKLIDDLFLFSKLDMEKLDFDFEKIKVKSFVGDLMEEFTLELEEKNCSFEYFDKMEEDCYVNVDRKRLHQVFRNIIGNAVKYCLEKEMTIKAKMYRQDAYVYVSIEDNGPGIPEDKLSHIFERFYRIDSERRKDFMSTGLGLAIARELVEAHKGKITVTSAENKGTCFTIMLPAIKYED